MFKNILKSVLFILAVFLFCLGNWLFRKFGYISFEQFTFHLAMGTGGLADADWHLVKSFINNCLIAPVALLVIVIILNKITIERVGLSSRFYQAAYGILNKSYVLLLALLLGVVFVLYKISFFLALHSYINYLRTGEDYFAMHYVNPKNVQITHKGKKKNLVFIYVESLEKAYANKNLFGRNLIHSLDTANVNNSYAFPQYIQAPGTGWTTGGLVSTQCGIPLKILSFMPDAKNASFSKSSSFLHNATCLGDILHQNGYYNEFINGPDLSFAGVGEFFSSHSYQKDMGREQWYQLGKTESDMNMWGLYDDELLDYAKASVDKLHHSQQPFNLTILTVDTHGTEGFLNKTCASRGVVASDFPGIVECSSNLVRNYVDYLESKGYLKDTVVVLVGDHLAMENPVYAKLLSEKNRYVFDLIIDQDKQVQNRQDITEFDIFPTILYSLGFRFPNGQLGLGYSGFGRFESAPSPDRYQENNDNLLGYSKGYVDLW